MSVGGVKIPGKFSAPMVFFVVFFDELDRQAKQQN
jgi:hypothetical protein